jgi:hypothetical protein
MVAEIDGFVKYIIPHVCVMTQITRVTTSTPCLHPKIRFRRCELRYNEDPALLDSGSRKSVVPVQAEVAHDGQPGCGGGVR